MEEHHDTDTENGSTQPETDEVTYIVGVGASAGGLEALEKFFGHADPHLGVSYVVIQHLSSEYKSLMVELLSKHTAMEVIKAESDLPVKKDKVYILPPGKTMTIEDGCLQLLEKDPAAHISLPIDIFFNSLALDCGEKGVGIILSGSGSDGAIGVRAIKEQGGLVMVQDETSSKFDGMPKSAIATGVADYILPPEEIPKELARYVSHNYSKNQFNTIAGIGSEKEKLNAIFQLIKNHNQIDFSQYKSSTVIRRIQRRMDVNRIHDLNDYLKLLLSSQREIAQLSRDMLIGVTNFFRDPQAFEYLREHAVYELVKKSRDGEVIRVWSAGCSSGEEAYSLAMLFSDVMEELGKYTEVKIFATDVDAESLEFASSGVYPESVAADIPDKYLKRYFTHINGKFAVIRQLREMIVFAPQNLCKDPPFTRLDMICCRNLLIYLQTAPQKKVFSLFRFSLNPGGFLFLGGSETLGEESSHFNTMDAKHKLFRLRTDSKHYLAGNLTPPTTMNLEFPRLSRQKRQYTDDSLLESVIRCLVERQKKPCIVVNSRFQLNYTFGDLQDVVQFSPGEASLDIIKLVPKELSLAMSTALHRVKKERKPVEYRSVNLKVGGQEQNINLSVSHFTSGSDEDMFYLLQLEFVQRETAEELSEVEIQAREEISQHVAELENDLHFTRENLQATVEELETSNEELQAANEELLSSNEELQSTNEELQSVNEELYTVNSEYHQKLKEMTELNNDIENLMRCTDIGSVFLNNDLHIRRYTPAVGQYINIIEKDIGRKFSDLSHKLRYPYLLDDIKAVLETKRNVEKEVKHQDGRPVLLKIYPYLDEGDRTEGVVVNYVDLTAVRNVHYELSQMGDEKDSILETIPETIVYCNKQCELVWANSSAFKNLEREPEELIGLKVGEIWDEATEKAVAQCFETRQQTFHDIEQTEGRKRTLQNYPVQDGTGGVRAVVGICRDYEQKSG